MSLYLYVWLLYSVCVLSNGASTMPTVLDRPSCKPNAVDTSQMRVVTTSRLKELRSLMRQKNIQAYVVLTEDAHQSAVASPYDSRRCYISGLCGSAGSVVVTSTKAALSVDSRYHLMAEDVLDCNWILLKKARITDWMNEELRSGDTVHINPKLMSIKMYQMMKNELKKTNVSVRSVSQGLIDTVWDNDTMNQRPAMPRGAVQIQELRFTGKRWSLKIKDVRAKLKEKSADAIILSNLLETAWLYNLRGSDASYTPVFFSFSIVTAQHVTLFLRDHDKKLKSSDLRKHLNTRSDGSCIGQTGICVQVKGYEQFHMDLKALSRGVGFKKAWIDKYAKIQILDILTESKVMIDYTPIGFMMQKKTEVEQKAMQRAFIKDNVAIIQFIAKLEKEVKQGIQWTEMKAATELEATMKKQEYNRGLSFPVMASSGFHSAIVHYVPTLHTDKAITTKEMYLQDSGGQYLDGTTDMTRTFHFGTPTELEKEAYTRVLSSNVNLAKAKWPKYTQAIQLSTFARQDLWNVGWDFGHSTGHGIGQYLNVHEGPLGISRYCKDFDTTFDEGIFMSDEPGYYEEGKFGVRLETVMMVEKVKLKYHYKNTTFLGFTPVTLVPFEPHLINVELLSATQIAWINWYNQKIRTTMGAELRKQKLEEAYEWMIKKTEKIERNHANRALTVSFTIVAVTFVCFITQMF